MQFNLSVLSNSLWPHGLQHTRFPCPLPTPGACSNTCPSSRWCHPTVSSSVIPFSSCLQSFTASSQFFASGGQSIGVSASASVLPMNTQDWFLLFARSIYCNLFLLDCFEFVHGCICICVYSIILILFAWFCNCHLSGIHLWFLIFEYLFYSPLMS